VFKKFLFLWLTFILSCTAAAYTSDNYVFQDEVTEKRYQSLIKELRCPKCQNQNLAGSNSPIANDLRREVYQLLSQGKADIEIVDFMVKRYGDFVLYRPKVSAITYVLWFGPILLILLGVVAVIVIVRKKSTTKTKLSLSDAQKAQLHTILKDQ
jgi:cytochrome c-type biogenesis protein CcmH